MSLLPGRVVACAPTSIARGLCRAAACLLVAAAASQANAQAPAEVQWHALPAEHVEGKGWADTKRPFDRLPARAEGVVRPEVWNLGRHSAGQNFRFSTNAKNIYVRWSVSSERLAMPHMPATGVSGVDLYRRGDDGWHFAGAAQPTKHPTNEALLAQGLPEDEAEYRLYLPLYNGVDEISIGVARDASFRLATPAASKKPVVVYGTSITQGGCASRPGMAYTAILGRRLNVPVINLGFSGNGKAEPEVAELLADIDAAALVLDPLPNLFAEQVRDRMPVFLGILRRRRPETPIVLVGSPVYPDAAFSAGRGRRIAESDHYLKDAFEARRAQGDRWIYFVPGCDLAAAGGDGTVDGVHPTDLGFVRMADQLEPALRNALAP